MIVVALLVLTEIGLGIFVIVKKGNIKDDITKALKDPNALEAIKPLQEQVRTSCILK
jgi:hypothetical protein